MIDIILWVSGTIGIIALAGAAVSHCLGLGIEDKVNK
jgi:hypothetical protein